MKPLLSLALLVLALCTAVTAFSQDDTASGKYSYTYKGKTVSLHASTRFVALDESAPELSSVIARHQLARDPLSARPALKRHRLGIYRSAPGALQSKRSLSALALSAPAAVQPVFEQGGALLIPSDEVLIGFRAATSLAQAQNHLSKVTEALGITALRPHRRNIFIATISNAAGGRAFEVARGVAALGEVSFSEPNLVVVQRGEKGKDLLLYNESLTGKALVTGEWGEGPAALATTAAGPHWSVLANLDFESDTLPQGWSTVYLTGHPAAYWGSSSYRNHGGARSLYCAGKGSQAVAAPGPAPANMTTGLFSPQLNLSGYQEVYLELWFWAKNELDTSGADPVIYDYPAVIVVDDRNGNVAGQLLAIAYDGDCTKDPTTSNGWRKLLYRVPPSLHSSDAHFEIQYISNGTNRTEGAYIDDLRIIATSDLDSATLSRDTYSARQYELRNLGQVAGLANGRSDLHLPEAWELVTVSPDVVVAVIDEGVELTHPDLNLVTGYDHNGIVGGQARSEDGGPRGSHGTNCAGNVGAIKDNGVGVVGTAPGVKIMPVYMGSTLAEVADALDVAVQHGANVLSNSWGWTGSPSADVEDAVKAALAAGRVVLFAAGNGPDRPPYTYNVAFPGMLTESTDVICVGASSLTDQHKGAASSDGEFFWGSSYIGAGPDVCAPGSWSYTTDLLGIDGDNDGSGLGANEVQSADYNPSFGGTSSSTPKVAGIVALMLSKNPALTPAQVKSILMASADDIEAAGIDDKTGAGRVNAYRAVLAVPAPADAPPPSVTATRPANGADSVPLQTSIAATFSASMDPSTLTSSFTVSNGVTGTVSYNSSTRTATFTPSAPLSTGTTYTATIGTGARSASGVALAAARSWSFRTTTDSSVNLLVNGSFEGGTSGWTGADSVGTGGIVNAGGSGHDGSDWYLVAGNGDSINSAIYQDFTVAAGSHPKLRFWYKVTTAELSTTNVYDTLTVQLKDPGSGAVLQSLKQLSNLDAGSSWVQSEEFDLTQYAGQQLRLELQVLTDNSLTTAFLIDDVTVNVPGTSGSDDAASAIRKKLFKKMLQLLLLFGEDG
jgi:subtilisin family serine protease